MESTATPWGWLNTAEVAGPPSPLAAVGTAPFCSVPLESGGPLPAKVRDHAVGVDLADPLVEGVGDVDVAVLAEGDGPGVVQLGLGGRPAVAGVAELGVVQHVAGHGLDHARLAGGGGRPGAGEDADAGAGDQVRAAAAVAKPRRSNGPPPVVRLSDMGFLLGVSEGARRTERIPGGGEPPSPGRRVGREAVGGGLLRRPP